MSPKTFAVTVAWNDRDFLSEFLTSFVPAPRPETQALVIDNGSDDGPAGFLRAQFPHVILVRNARNLGYAHALNQALRYAFDAWEGEDLNDRFVLLVSPDTVFTPGCFEDLQAALAASPQAGSATGMLLRAFRDPSSEHPFAEAVRSDVIESVGIERGADDSFLLRGAGEIDRAQFSGQEPFGAPTSFGLFRASALASVRVGDRDLPAGRQVADTDLRATCVAADLAWRLRVAGWTSLYVPKARAFRFCGVRAAHDMASRSPRSSGVSPRDRVEMLLKNETLGGLVLGFPRRFFSWVMHLWRPSEAAAPFAMFPRLPSIWRKRRAVIATRPPKA